MIEPRGTLAPIVDAIETLVRLGLITRAIAIVALLVALAALAVAIDAAVKVRRLK